MRIIIVTFTALFFSPFSFGQRIVGRIVYRYSEPYLIDTIEKGKISKFTVSADTILDLGDTKILNIQKVDKQQINLVDSLIKKNLLEAIVYMDSISFVTQTFDLHGHRMTAEDFISYKSIKSERFERQLKSEIKRQKKSDKYYSGYLDNGDTWIIVMFDPLKDKKRMMGDIVWFDYAEPILVNLTTLKIYILGTQPK